MTRYNTPEKRAKHAAEERVRRVRGGDRIRTQEREYRATPAQRKRKKVYMKGYSAQPEQVAARAQYQKDHPEVNAKAQRVWRDKNPRRAMLGKSRSSAKARGIEFTITEKDLVWPEFCPVLGIKLEYVGRGHRRDAFASFDRWDTSLGYVLGNVFVISWRANRIKWNCTKDELIAVAAYAVTKPSA